jgi:Glutathione S-transferase, N-terminal domain
MPVIVVSLRGDGSNAKSIRAANVPLKFYFSGAPNPTKVALFLEEAGLPYEAIPVDTRRGEQHKPEYLAINPNAVRRRLRSPLD